MSFSGLMTEEEAGFRRYYLATRETSYWDNHLVVLKIIEQGKD
jgi:hypothetical protein